MLELKPNYPIVIVGGGMAGCCLAIGLARAGIESLVLEASATSDEASYQSPSIQSPSFDERSIALSESSLRILEQLDLFEAVSTVAEPIKNIHVSDRGHYGFARLKASELGVEQLGMVIENNQFGQVLHQQMAHYSEINYLAPAKVKTIENQPEKALLTVDYQGQQKTIESQLVLLADGARSPLREQLKFDSEITDYKTSAIICNLETQLPHENWAFERFTKDGPLALLPLSRNRLSLVWSKPRAQSEDFIAMSALQFAKELSQTFGARLGKITRVGVRKSFPLMQLVSRNMIKNRCLLMGNSAQSLHPIAGQGFNLAIRDIYCLCSLFNKKVNKKLSKKMSKKSSKQKPSTQDWGDYSLLRQYQDLRQADRSETIETTEALARLFANDFAPLSMARNLLMKGLDITPFAKAQLAQKAMGFRAEPRLSP